MIASLIHIYAIWVRRFGFRRGNGNDFLLEGKKITIRGNQQFAKEIMLFGVGCMCFVWCKGYVCFYSGVGNVCFLW